MKYGHIRTATCKSSSTVQSRAHVRTIGHGCASPFPFGRKGREGSGSSRSGMGICKIGIERFMKEKEVKKMSDDENERERKHERRHGEQSPENIKEILNVVSSEVPSLIKNVLGSVFSEEAGRNMGKAASAYYKEMKAGGLPEEVAVKLTQDYMRTFTSIGDMLRSSGRREDIGGQVERKIREKMSERFREKDEEEEE